MRYERTIGCGVWRNINLLIIIIIIKLPGDEKTNTRLDRLEIAIGWRCTAETNILQGMHQNRIIVREYLFLERGHWPMIQYITFNWS